MASIIAPVARQQFFDNQGNVAAGMKLFTYLATTTTKQATYTTSAGAVQNANPIELNSAGRTPSGLWLDESVLYKFVLAPANDTDPPTSPVWTEDNIQANGVNLAALANTTDVTKGDALVGFKQSSSGGALTGAIARTVHQKLQETVSVLDFGAPPDGAADNTATFNSAITAANIRGLNVLVPGSANHYLVLSAALKSNVKVILEPGAIIRKNGGAVGTHIFDAQGTLGTGVNLSSNAAIGDLTVSAASSTGLAAEGWVLIRDDVYVTGASGRNQEIAQILSISGGGPYTVTLKNRLIGSYATASTAQILPLTPVRNASIVGEGKLEIQSGTDGGGAFFDLTVGCHVGAIKVTGPDDDAGVLWERSFNFTMDRTDVRDGQNTSTGGFGYGIMVGESSHHGRIFMPYSERVRENPISYRARHIDVISSHDRYNVINGWNTHGTGNKHIRFICPLSEGSAQDGVGVGGSGTLAPDEDVTIINPTVINPGRHGISIVGVNGSEHRRIAVVSPKIIRPGMDGVAARFGILVTEVVGGYVSSPHIDGQSAANVSAGVAVTSSEDFDVDGGRIENCVVGVQATTVSYVHSKNITFNGNSARAFDYTGTNVGCRVTNNDADSDTVLIDAATLQVGNSWQEQRKVVSLSDHFIGDSLDAQWGSAVGSDPQVVAPAIITARRGGHFTMTTGDDAAGTMAVNGVQLHRYLNWAATGGPFEIEICLWLNAITDVCLFLGLTDQIAALEMPVVASGVGDGLTQGGPGNATNCVGVIIDTAMTTDNWWLVGTKADVAATAQNSAVAPTANTLETWKIVVSGGGAATFFRNGTQVGTQMSNAVTGTTLLTPVVAAFSRGAASRNVEGDFINISMPR